MSAPASPADRTAPSARPERAPARRWQFWVLLLVVGALVAVIMQLVSSRDDQRYGLNNTGLQGYAALKNVLEDEGVEMEQSYSSNDALRLARERPDATVVLFTAQYAPPRSFLEDLPGEHDVVIVSTEAAVAADVLGDPRIAPGARVAAPGDGVAADPSDNPLGCSIPPAMAAETLQVSGSLFTVDSGGGSSTGDGTDGDAQAAGDVEGCFPVSVEEGPPEYPLVAAGNAVLLGTPDAFTNRNITEEGNAALALGLFGQSEDVIWYTPSGADDLEADEWASPWDFLPAWVGPLSLWLVLCGGVLILVQGRRHGPVVAEPLPVEVPAAESAEGRGRMYQNANAYRESAWTLRSALLVRMSRLLRMGAQPQQRHILEAIARESGSAVAEIERALDPRPVQGNAALLAFARSLDRVEDDVRGSMGLPPRRLDDALGTHGATASGTPQHERSESSTGGSHP